MNYPYGDRIEEHYQAIIPGYILNCNQTCGSITEWGVDVRRGHRLSTDLYTLDLQVWRPSPTVNASTGTGCYSLVGNNRLVSVTPTFGLVVVTPAPQDYIQFQPGDVLGFYVEEAPGPQHGVVYLSNLTETVWLTSIEPTVALSWEFDEYCPEFNVSWSLLQAAPVISISAGKLEQLSMFLIRCKAAIAVFINYA